MALGSATVGRFQQRIQLVLFQVRDQWTRNLLRPDGLNLPAPVQMFGALQTDEPCQGMDRRKALISRGDSTATSFLQIPKERSSAVRRNIFHPKPFDPSACTASDEWKKLP
jgi:hypothetical protein